MARAVTSNLAATSSASALVVGVAHHDDHLRDLCRGVVPALIVCGRWSDVVGRRPLAGLCCRWSAPWCSPRLLPHYLTRVSKTATIGENGHIRSPMGQDEMIDQQCAHGLRDEPPTRIG